MTVSPMMSVWADMAGTRPDAPALTVSEHPSISWRELHRRSNRLARLLAEHGTGPGDLVTIALPTGLEAVLALMAALKLGAIPNPISSRLPPGELEALLELAAPRVVVTNMEEGLGDRARIPGAPDLSGYDDADLPEIVASAYKAPTSGGSTGRPKIILSGSPAVIDDSPDAGNRKLGFPVDGCCLFAGPIYHNTAVLGILTGLSLRNHVVIEEYFEPELTLRLIDRHHPSFTVMVPTMMNRIWRLPAHTRQAYDLSSLRMLVHNAAPCPPQLKRAWLDWLGPDRVFENYAATEQSAMTLCDGHEWLQRPGTVGAAITGEIEIRGEDGRTLPPDHVGTIWMRRPEGAPRTFTYIGEPTPEDPDRWETVGDLGHLDTAGYLFLADRRTDMVISGGANVYPAEVEAVISSHPEVVDSVVIGLPDDDLGQRVHAIVETPPRSTLTDTEVRDWVTDRLSRPKRPRSYEFTTTALRNDAGKVRRAALRAERLPPPDSRCCPTTPCSQ